MITLDNGERVVVQRYRRREDAEYRLRVMRGLRASATRAGIPLPWVRDVNLDGDPAWVVYDVRPGVPVPEAGELGPGGPRFPQMARIMGELLAAFRRLPAAGLGLDQLWADPERLAASAAGWARQLSITNADHCILSIRECKQLGPTCSVVGRNLAGAAGEQPGGDLYGFRRALGVADAVEEHLRGEGSQGRGILRNDGDTGVDELG